MPPKICYYYITSGCNDFCHFCGLWEDKNYQNIKDEEIGVHLNNLYFVRKKKASEINVTGGEPLLYEKLPEFLRKAKELDMPSIIHTNGILYKERSKELKGLSKEIIFSLDYPQKEENNESKGVESFTEVLSSIELAKSTGENPSINFILTRDSVRFLPEMVELSEKLQVILYVHAVYDYYGTQGFDEDTYSYIKYYFKKKYVRINLAEFQFVKDHGNKALFSRCKASHTTFTFLPDGTMAAPCFFNQGGREGKESVCQGCTRYSYMIPSFKIGFDRLRFLDFYSGWFNNRKETKK